MGLDELEDGLRRLTVHPNPGVFVSRGERITAYPPELIERILTVKGLSYVGDEIAREEDPEYIAMFLRWSVLSYVPEEAFSGARILDFGSGAGASTVVLARMFPESEIVGVELEPDLIDIAQGRADFYGLANVRFLESPDPQTLPSELGTFDFINLSAVYEHLLPDERPRLLSQLFGILNRRGVIFVSQLPHRYYVVEAHTTGLPFLNYFPDGVAHRVANRLSPRIDPAQSWPELLRNGIRGGTASSVKRDLEAQGASARRLKPNRLGASDHADVWYRYSTEGRPHPAKQAMRLAFKIAEHVTRQPFAPGLSVAFQKA